MTKKTIRLRDKKILVREGSGTDASLPVLVCIHGNLGSGRWFAKFLDTYPGRAVAPDMPNFGESEHIKTCTMAGYADWIAAIMAALGIERAAVLGHSLGGAVAMELLASRPELVSQLILVDSSPLEGLVTPKEYHPAIEAYKADKLILAQALAGIAPMNADEAFFAELVDDAWQMNRACFIGHAEELGTADYTERLAATSIPVAVFRGAHDVLITADHADRLASHLGGSVRTFAASGHSPMVEVPDEFGQAVLETVRGTA